MVDSGNSVNLEKAVSRKKHKILADTFLLDYLPTIRYCLLNYVNTIVHKWLAEIEPWTAPRKETVIFQPRILSRTNHVERIYCKLADS